LLIRNILSVLKMQRKRIGGAAFPRLKAVSI
jgi:hypothetical protein